MKTKYAISSLVLATMLVVFTGCGKSDPSSPLSDSIANEDAAESIASTIGQDDGGALDQFADVSDVATVAGLQAGSTDLKSGASLVGVGSGSVDTTYNPVTGKWTVTLQRQRGTIGDPSYALITRTYEYQFLNAAGQPQKYWRVPTNGAIDTAVSLTFTIVSGTGEHHTPHLSQKLTALSGTWTATGLNTPMITINGTYSRSAVDTITTRNAVRMLDHTVSLTFTNIQFPRGSRGQIAQQATGTISGSYNATVSFQRGALYGDKTISRDFTVTLGQGKGTITLGGKAFAALLASGILG